VAGKVIRLADRAIELDPDYRAIMRELRRFDGEPELSHIYRMLVLAHEQTHAERALLIQLVAEAAERERAG
jgi:hypothetical protein